ncbi:hypothetical protein Taro_049718 [Colocasia esculenta]|uniref:Uncharacterized protein n=1 Tax=Colocasia esculenta TaxID=4460 RepID=A0A843XBL8_COLES|nr:hypothetical protein [Colocasia esculenta]
MADPIAAAILPAAVNAIADRVGNLFTAVWDYTLGLPVNAVLLPRNAEQLAEEIERLEALRDDLLYQAEREARQDGARVTNRLLGWMRRVASLAIDASNFQRSFESHCFCLAGFCLGYTAAELLRWARRLNEEGNFLSTGGLLSSGIQQVPSETSSSTLVGREEVLQRVASYIMDDGVGIIGIYGMGGVGKTSILKIINNEFLLGEACREIFEVVIWVTVSRDVQISTIQKSIADRLWLKLPSDAPKEMLFSVLSQKRFVLLLDDVWEKLNFEEIGIPFNKSKILFTTRSKQVCREMDADVMVKVGFLDAERSRKLFRSKFGKTAPILDNPDIQPLAKEVVERYRGLPIALITVGRAMVKAKTADDWRDAMNKLDHHPAELSPGMQRVLRSLKYSFEMLKDEALQKCLLYFAIFPKGKVIPKEQIIDYWICEGFLDLEDFEEYDIEDTRCRGFALIIELQDACLLGEVSDDSVMLHEIVRDMALWIAQQDFMVLAGSNNNPSQVPQLSNWENATRISLIDNETIEEPPSSSPRWNLSFQNLTTLLLQGSKLARNVPKGFFTSTSMPALRVLNLARTGLLEFPIEITSLISLQYLCLSHNDFTSLPVELGLLTNLRQLLLRDIHSLTSIPPEALSPLSHLQVLDMAFSGYQFGDDTRHPQLELSDLANLRRLCELHLPPCSWASLYVIVASPVLRRSTRHLNVHVCRGSPPPAGVIVPELIARLWNLRELYLEGNPEDPVEVELRFYLGLFQNLQVLSVQSFRKAKISMLNQGSEFLFPRLRELHIKNSDGIAELTWVSRLPSLEILNVAECNGVTALLLDEGGLSHDDDYLIPFRSLSHMSLSRLPSLTSISTRPLLLPSLQSLKVLECPQLKRLPFGPQSAKNIRAIKGQKVWWDGLEWDNSADQERFNSKLEEI